VETWAQREGIVAEDYTSLLSNEKLMAFMQGEIDRLTESFASFERIKKFCLLPELFSQDGGELTPSLKIKRRIVEEKYAAEIEKMYRDD
jgi:long-chain acyl-CoA synthetase